MAFAALISLKHTIEGFLKNSGHVSSITQYLKSAQNEIRPLQQLVESLETIDRSSKRADAAVSLIREAACHLEDVLESHDSRLESDSDTPEVKQEIISLIRNMLRIRQECIVEDDEEVDQVTQSTTYVRGMSPEMVGLQDEFTWLRRALNFGTEQTKVVSLFGMAGVDDMWSTQAWEELQKFLPENTNHSRVLVTTRLEEVAERLNREEMRRVRFLNDRESWELLRREVFPEDWGCPIQLEKAGMKIAKNCEGLPLAIVTVAKFLSKLEKSPECWMMTADR